MHLVRGDLRVDLGLILLLDGPLPQPSLFLEELGQQLRVLLDAIEVIEESSLILDRCVYFWPHILAQLELLLLRLLELALFYVKARPQFINSSVSGLNLILKLPNSLLSCIKFVLQVQIIVLALFSLGEAFLVVAAFPL